MPNGNGSFFAVQAHFNFVLWHLWGNLRDDPRGRTKGHEEGTKLCATFWQALVLKEKAFFLSALVCEGAKGP